MESLVLALDALTSGKPSPDLDAFATYDPRAPTPGPHPAAGAAATLVGGPGGDVLVCVVGGGCLAEAEACASWAARGAPARRLVYGATELVGGAAFAGDLAALGRAAGLAGGKALLEFLHACMHHDLVMHQSASVRDAAVDTDP